MSTSLFELILTIYVKISYDFFSSFSSNFLSFSLCLQHLLTIIHPHTAHREKGRGKITNEDENGEKTFNSAFSASQHFFQLCSL